MERLRESRDELHKLSNEPIIAGGSCRILAMVYNAKPLDTSSTTGGEAELPREASKKGSKSNRDKGATSSSMTPIVRNPYAYTECALNQE